ncbi:MAG: hypothetical protein QXY62_00615 [Candidatus Altiarchaeota archaeon]
MESKIKFRKRFLIFFLFLALISLVSYVSAVSLASVYGPENVQKETPTNLVIDFELTKIEQNLRPGSSGVLQIVFKNTGTKPAENIEILIYDSPEIKANAKFELGTIEGGFSKTISKVIKVEKNALPGVYTLTVVAVFDSVDTNNKRTKNVQRRWEIPVMIYANPNFQVSIAKKEFFKDVEQKLEISAHAKNPAKDVSVVLNSNCATVLGSSKRYMSDIERDSEFNIDYTIKPISTGICTLTLSIDYYDISSGILMTDSISFGIDVQSSDIMLNVANLYPETLSYGDVKNLTITLKNFGTSKARDVIAKLTLTKPFTALKTSEKHIGDIPPKETKDVTFEILLDTSAENVAYQLPLTLTYYDASNSKQSVDKTIGIKISGKPEIYLSLGKNSDLFTKGSKGKIFVDIVNSAFTNVKFLTLKLLQTDEYKVLSTSEIYVGNLDSDDTDTEEFTIQLSDNVKEGSKIPLKFELSYREEGSNEKYIETKEISLEVLSSSVYGAMKPSTTVANVISIVALLAGAFIFAIVLWLLYKIFKLTINYLDKKFFKK